MTHVGCPAKCVYCAQDTFCKSYEARPDPKKMLDYDDYVRWLEDVPKDAFITFAGFSEPFINPRAVDMVCYAHERGYKQIQVYTTLMNLSKEDIIRLSEIPFNPFVIHVPDTQGLTKIPFNDAYLEKVRLCVDLNLSGFSATHYGYVRPELEDILGDNLKTYKLLSRVGTVDKSKIPPNIPFAEVENDFTGKKIKCKYQRLTWREENGKVEVSGATPMVLPNGDLVLCCMDMAMKQIVGNLNEQTYSEVLAGTKLQRIAETMAMKNDDRIICHKCEEAEDISHECEEVEGITEITLLQNKWKAQQEQLVQQGMRIEQLAGELSASIEELKKLAKHLHAVLSPFRTIHKWFSPKKVEKRIRRLRDKILKKKKSATITFEESEKKDVPVDRNDKAA